MAERSSSVAAPADRTLVTTRVFDAPRDMVFKAWTDPKQLAQWFAPQGLITSHCELDVRPGGELRIDMKGVDPSLGPDFYGVVFPGRGTYREVVPNERLAFTFAGEGEGQAPPKLLMTVVFEDEAGKTKLTIYQAAETVAGYEELVKMGASEGLRQSLDNLAALLRGSERTGPGRMLVLTRVFDAPRDLVWTAYTDPKHIVKWMFARDWKTPFAETDLRPGGAFRIGMRPADDSEEGFVFEGTYRELVKPERIVQSISDGRVMTATFADERGKTKLTLSVEMAMTEEDERTGWTQILENLAAHLRAVRGK
ncbi:MAG TPA: SRPBCC domain-containing protein [Candidatus Limnocylindria bacterium]|jgi:uncharacterized protein YndB with AHSA1/START domain|nr:SRPBCC domain-containing protein [Candidatus Limnocylindria bacterium]